MTKHIVLGRHSYLEHIVQRHNLDVISRGIQNIFPGGFRLPVSQFRVKLQRKSA